MRRWDWELWSWSHSRPRESGDSAGLDALLHLLRNPSVAEGKLLDDTLNLSCSIVGISLPWDCVLGICLLFLILMRATPHAVNFVHVGTGGSRWSFHITSGHST